MWIKCFKFKETNRYTITNDRSVQLFGEYSYFGNEGNPQEAIVDIPQKVLAIAKYQNQIGDMDETLINNWKIMPVQNVVFIRLPDNIERFKFKKGEDE